MNKTLKYIVLLTFACFVGKGYAQELKSEVFSLRLLPCTYECEDSGY